jgi:hypothetical protein
MPGLFPRPSINQIDQNIQNIQINNRRQAGGVNRISEEFLNDHSTNCG